MEENGGKGGDLHLGHVSRKLGVRTSGMGPRYADTGGSSPSCSPRKRRPNADRTIRRGIRALEGEVRRIRGDRVVLWVMLIVVWAYVGFHVNSRWAHGYHRQGEFVGYEGEVGTAGLESEPKRLAGFVASNASSLANEELISKSSSSLVGEEKDGYEGEVGTVGLKSDAKRLAGFVASNASSLANEEVTSNSSSSLVREEKDGLGPPRRDAKKKRTRRSRRRVKKPPAKPGGTEMESRPGETEDGLVPRRNTSSGVIVGPFGKTEDNILGWGADRRRGSCNRTGEFTLAVHSRSFVLIFHELSMTGAPISMMELATEILSCGGSVSAVVLSRKGGLITELDRRGIRVLNDRAELSFKTAMKSDLVIAGSAVCSSWIEPYLARYPAGSSRIVWWIMENRREYFERSKNLLGRVKMVTFLTHLQSEQWQLWCKEAQIHLNLPPTIVPLSVNDELAFIAGIPCALNTPSLDAEKMSEKRNLLRTAVRKNIGLGDNDMLVMSLSSINPPKGQRLFLESAVLVAEHNVSLNSHEIKDASIKNETTASTIMVTNTSANSTESNSNDTESAVEKGRNHSGSSVSILSGNHTSESTDQGVSASLRKLLSESETQQEQSLKVLIGSLGSKSNKPLYIKAMLGLLSQHPNMSKLVYWTPATTRVASLYAAADVYVINAQGIGETFGRVTIEAMAFGLPVLGTDAGGTKEIVEHNITGLLHPVGREGIRVLSRNILYLMKNPSVRREMGMLGRQRVEEKYLKNHMYERFAQVLTKCMKIN